ncbi:hypothetical protein [Anabaena sp. 4-3]|uniref:hypothetical protein n=1 Tax=Anabaena sp. 4-3 TaxID=1811979 RepID=UPI00082BB9CD|nr:hypothetical protein [Anabaena sp. 4-3]
MSEVSPGNWQPWEPNGSGRHQCNSNKLALPKTTLPLPSLLARAETYLTRCPWCREHIYYHTNGYGDSVYFDSLGYPWQIHHCWDKYWREKKDRQRVLNTLSNLETLDQQKLQILIGILSSIVKVESNSQLLYIIDETTLAERLGISVKKLKIDYGHLYKAEVQGIRLNISLPSKVAKNLQSISTNILSELISCKYCGQLVWQRKLAAHLKKCHPLPTVTCIYCNEVFPKPSFKQHLVKCIVQKKKKKRKKNRRT